MISQLREEHLYPEIIKFVNSKGYIPAQEVRPHSRSVRRVDIIGVKPRKNEVISVEAKLSNYSSVLTQATRNLIISDFVYISFPLEFAFYVKKMYGQELSNLGIGIIGVNGKVKELLHARRSEYVDLDRKAVLIKMAFKAVN